MLHTYTERIGALVFPRQTITYHHLFILFPLDKFDSLYENVRKNSTWTDIMFLIIHIVKLKFVYLIYSSADVYKEFNLVHSIDALG